MAVKGRHRVGSITVAREVGITLRQLNYWVASLKIVFPISEQHGQRVFRRFSEQHVKTLKRVKQFLDQGYTLKSAIARATRHPSHGRSRFAKIGSSTRLGDN